MNALPYAAAAPAAINFTPTSDAPEVSVLVLVDERPADLVELYKELAAGVRAVCDGYEVVFVVEPAFADVASALRELAARREPVRVVTVGQALGEGSLLRVGAQHCRGSIIVTVPAARRVETAVIAKLIDAVENGVDLAVARRWPRHDSWIVRAQTRLFNSVVARVVGNGTKTISDLACGVRAMRRDLLDRILLYGDLALFLPLLAARDGYSVMEIPAPQHTANQQARLRSPALYLRRVFDLLGLFFFLRFTEKPLRFFGLMGSAIAVPGAVILATVVVQRLAGQGIADRPLLLVGVLFLVLGIQSIALGLLGEIIVHLHAGQRPAYRLRGES